MFVANVLTAWVEGLKAVFHDTNYLGERMRDIPIHTEYPMAEVDYPSIWVNYSMQGDVKNVGIGHVEHYDTDTGTAEVLRWHFGGLAEITVAAMSNLERALLLDELLKTVAIARIDENQEGILRSTVERNDLIGQTVTWESVTVSGFGEMQGTPWGTDDVIYEATVSLVTTGEVVLDPRTGELVRLSDVILTPLLDGDPTLPTPGQSGWV